VSERASGASQQRGFTLIEILVVMVIIGVVLTFATLSVNPSSPADRLDTESQRLLALTQAAADDAILYGKTIGLQITGHGYRFIALGPTGWKLIGDPDSPMRPRRLDDDIHVDRLATDKRNQNNTGSTAAGDLTLSSSPIAAANPSGNNTNQTVPRPDALFLSSGELVPFRLEVSAKHVKHRFDIVGQTNGDIRIERIDQ
jgi:general secretion pathway protein H